MNLLLILVIVLAIVLALISHNNSVFDTFIGGRKGFILIKLEYLPLKLKKSKKVVPLLKGDSLTFNKSAVVKTYPEIIQSFHKQDKNNSGRNKEYYPNLLPMIWNSMNDIIKEDFNIRNDIKELAPDVYKLGEKLIRKLVVYRISDSDLKLE